MSAVGRNLRWGVLGCARIARESVIPAILRATNSELHAVASRDEAKLAAMREKFPGIAKGYRGYEDVLADPAVEAVYIPLPNSLHREWTMRAAAAGKHVLCEKPIALTAAEAREMIDACARHGVQLMEAFMYRFTARTRQVIEIVRSGVLGDIRQVGSSFRFFLTNPAAIKLRPELGGGSLYDVGCYPVNFIGLVADLAAGGEPGAGGLPVSVATEAVMEGGVDVSASAVLRYSSGLLATMHCGFNAHVRVHAEIVGTRGVLEVPDTFHDRAGALVLTIGEGRREIPVPSSDRYRAEIEAFAAAVLEDRSPEFSLAETLRNAEVLDRLRAAAR
jgi:predicted dehydrogenase